MRRAVGQGDRLGEPDKPLKVLAFDEARFGLINWHRRRYCPKGFRPPYIVRRAYNPWTYLYAGQWSPLRERVSAFTYRGWIVGACRGILEGLSEAYPHNHLLVVLFGVLRAIAQKRSSVPRT